MSEKDIIGLYAKELKLAHAKIRSVSGGQHAGSRVVVLPRDG